MTIEQVKDGLLIKTDSPINMIAAQKIIDYYNVQDIVSKAAGTEQQALELAKEADKKWWEANKSRFIK